MTVHAAGAAAAVTRYLDERLPRYIDELTQLCAIDCPTSSKPGVDRAGSWVREWAARRGWAVTERVEPDVGNSLIVTLRGSNPRGGRVLLAAHLDTVYPVGTVEARPTRREGDALIGPGTADNKSGLLSGLYAMAALEDLGLLTSVREVVLVCGSDEERDMRSSGALLQELASDFGVGLVLECGRENGDVVAARKGQGRFELEVHGRAAHAGTEPHLGANAILAMAQHTVALQLLNGMIPGVTVNVGVVAGGTVSNTVPDHARAEVDVRVVHQEDMERVGAAVAAIAAAAVVPGTNTTIRGGWRFSPMPPSAPIATLLEAAQACATELGFSIQGAATGGISYANILAGAGLPVLDGLGPVGGLDHSPDEYILVSSIVPRTALLALLILQNPRCA